MVGGVDTAWWPSASQCAGVVASRCCLPLDGGFGQIVRLALWRFKLVGVALGRTFGSCRSPTMASLSVTRWLLL